MHNMMYALPRVLKTYQHQGYQFHSINEAEIAAKQEMKQSRQIA